jgi:hypothetical protein
MLSQTVRLKFSLKHLNPTKQIKRRKKLQSSVKNMHYSIIPQEIKTENEKLGYTVTNMWN